MSVLNKFVYFCLIILTFSCSKTVEETTSLTGDKIEIEMIAAYNAGSEAFKQQQFIKAAKKFNEAELLFPQSEWASKASLLAAYSFYIDGYNDDSIFQLTQFIKTYPKDKKLAYANYLLAMSHYSKIVDEKKDLGPLIKSKKRFEYIVKTYPESDFALDSRFKLDLIHETLASKEMYIAKHYIKKQKWIAAINRLKYIVDEYQTTIFVEEALHRLVEVHYKMGLEEEAKKYASLLGYNYTSSNWYEESYKIFNKKYKNPYKKIEKNKKLSTLDKMKSILD